MKSLTSLALAGALSLSAAAQATPTMQIGDKPDLNALGMEYSVVMVGEPRLQLRTHVKVATKNQDVSFTQLTKSAEEFRDRLQTLLADQDMFLKDINQPGISYPMVVLKVMQKIQSEVTKLPADLLGSGIALTVMIVPESYPKDAKPEDYYVFGTDSDEKASARLADNIYAVKANSIGYVTPKSKDGGVDPDGKLPIYFLGALFSVTLDQQTREVVGQVALGLNPATSDAGGGMTFVVPPPLALGGSTNAGESPNVLLTVTQDLIPQGKSADRMTLKDPELDLKFGLLTTAKKEGGVMRFQLDQGTLCEFIYMTPYLQGVANPLGIKDMKLNLRSLDLIIKKDKIISTANVGGPIPYVGGCYSGVDYVNSQFKDQGNAQYAKAIETFENQLLNLLNLSSDQLFAAIVSARKSAGIDGE